MRGKPVCRLHGGKGGAPNGERNGAYKTGRYAQEVKRERMRQRAIVREVRRIIQTIR